MSRRLSNKMALCYIDHVSGSYVGIYRPLCRKGNAGECWICARMDGPNNRGLCSCKNMQFDIISIVQYVRNTVI